MPATQLTTQETAARLGLSVDRIRQLAKAGRIRHEMTPLGRLFDASDVERLRAERHANEGAA